MNSLQSKANKLFMSFGMYIPIICVAIVTYFDLQKGAVEDWNKYLLYNLLTIGLGYQMVASGIMHIFFGAKIAAYIGWPKGSPFQFEVGLADLGMGVLGIMCGYFDGSFWLATIVISSVFLWGCVVGHLRDMIKNKNFNPGSAGFVFWWGLLMPIALIVLYMRY
nr:hypothetical protein [Bacteroidota bacterium]